jgi:hypothetical protein
VLQLLEAGGGLVLVICRRDEIALELGQGEGGFPGFGLESADVGVPACVLSGDLFDFEAEFGLDSLNPGFEMPVQFRKFFEREEMILADEGPKETTKGVEEKGKRGVSESCCCGVLFEFFCVEQPHPRGDGTADSGIRRGSFPLSP